MAMLLLGLERKHSRSKRASSSLTNSISFAAAAGTAWYTRQQIAATAANSQLWVSSHLEFVGVLWKIEALRERLEELLDMTDHGIQFHWLVGNFNDCAKLKVSG